MRLPRRQIVGDMVGLQPVARTASGNAPAGDHARICALLEAVLAELRGIRRVIERSESEPEEGLHDEAGFLEAVSALLGNQVWTCSDLMDEVATGDSPEVARLQVVLAAIGVDGERSLGNYLRDCWRRGGAVAQYTLKRHSVTRSGARRWSVHAS